MDQSLSVIMDQFKSFLSLLKAPIFQISNTNISIFSLFISFSIIILSFKLARYLGHAVNKALAKRDVDSGIRDSLEKFVRYIIIATSFVFALDIIGVSINSLAAIGAVLMVGIGFGLQNITQNFFSGIIILIERPIKVGDIIRVGSVSGRVIDIYVRSTVIQTRDDISIIVPNSKLVSEEVINESYTGEKIRQHIRVGVSYGSDLEKVSSLLILAAQGNARVLKTPAPIAIFEDFGESSLNFDLRFYCSDIWEMDAICSQIRFEINRLFKEESIEIPFPQRDLHVKYVVPNTTRQI